MTRKTRVPSHVRRSANGRPLVVREHQRNPPRQGGFWNGLLHHHEPTDAELRQEIAHEELEERLHRLKAEEAEEKTIEHTGKPLVEAAPREPKRRAGE